MHPIESGWIELSAADGTSLRAWMARPVGLEHAPGLIVFQEVFGVNAHMRDVTERWAREGFAALCPELFHRTMSDRGPGADFPYDQLGPAREEAGKMSREGIEADARACLDWFEAQPQTQGRGRAAVGYCMGGRISFLAHALVPLDCAVSYYGGMMHQALDLVPRLEGPHLFLWGGKDAAITWEQRPQLLEALKQAGKPFVDLVFSEAEHGFNCDRRPQHFHPEAARMAWAASLAFIREHAEKD